MNENRLNENRLYVGGLDYSVDDEGLKSMFEGIAAVAEGNSAMIIRDRETGCSKGFGFVQMATAEDARKAIAELHGQSADREARKRGDRDGRSLKVSMAKPKEEGSHRGGSREGGGFHGSGRRERGGYNSGWDRNHSRGRDRDSEGY